MRLPEPMLAKPGPLPTGRGWSFDYDIKAVTDARGNVSVQAPAGGENFTLQTGGTYRAARSSADWSS